MFQACNKPHVSLQAPAFAAGVHDTGRACEGAYSHSPATELSRTKAGQVSACSEQALV
jgi:hypothetical protein